MLCLRKIRYPTMAATALAAAALAFVPASASASAPSTTVSMTGPAAWTVVDPGDTQFAAIPDGCKQARAYLARDAAQGIRRVMCMTSASQVATAALPALCHLNRQYFNRFADCLYSGWVDTIIDVETGDPVGTVTGATILWNGLSYNSRSWQENIRIVIAAVTGEGAGTTVTAPIDCQHGSTGCKATGRGVWAGQLEYLAADPGDVYNGHLGWESPGSATDKMAVEVDMIFDNPIANPAPLTIGPTEKIRCDSEAIFKPTKGGCVYQNATANILVISTSDKTITQAAKFIEAAQKKIHNHAGVYSHGKALTRLTSARTIRANRRVACKGLTVKKGQSCDEYPFASTNQGAALVPRDDWDREAVNAAQNSKVGSYLSSFLLHLRIASDDSYYVKIDR